VKARGIDPGETIGWCDIERESAGVFVFIGGGTCAASDVQRSGPTPGGSIGALDVLTIETPKELHPGSVRVAGPAKIVQTARDLISTAKIAERIACGAAARGVRIVEPTAGEVRKAFGIRIGAQRRRGEEEDADQQIAALIPLAIRGWPKRSNRHVRDAGLSALYGLGPAEVQAAVALALRGAA
jgi:hypothetical protein